MEGPREVRIEDDLKVLKKVNKLELGVVESKDGGGRK